MNQNWSELALKLATSIQERTIKHRRLLHQIPELGEDLPKTTQYIKDFLDSLGVGYVETTNSGIIAKLEGERPGRVLAIRADMDALPIEEKTNLPFASTNGNMHACGHDAHMAILLSTIECLIKNKTKWEGSVISIFQPAEETSGGAEQMIEEGALEGVDAVIALHIGSIFPEVQNGVIGIKTGNLMASVDRFTIDIKGKGGHGARPHECVDPILSMASMILELQQIVSRNIDPLNSAVISIGAANSGKVANIIPDTAQVIATVRALNEDDRVLIQQRVRQVVKGVASSHNVNASLTYENFYPPTVNEESITKFVQNQATSLFGENSVISMREASMGTEDFSYYGLKRPACFFILGSYKKAFDGKYYPHHNSLFDIDEDVLEKGVALFLASSFSFNYFYTNN